MPAPPRTTPPTLGDLLIADADEVVITEGLLALAVEDFVQIEGRFSAGGFSFAIQSLSRRSFSST